MFCDWTLIDILMDQDAIWGQQNVPYPPDPEKRSVCGTKNRNYTSTAKICMIKDYRRNISKEHSQKAVN